MKIFLIYSFSNFHICNTVVLSILIMLYIQDLSCVAQMFPVRGHRPRWLALQTHIPAEDTTVWALWQPTDGLPGCLFFGQPRLMGLTGLVPRFTILIVCLWVDLDFQAFLSFSPDFFMKSNNVSILYTNAKMKDAVWKTWIFFKPKLLSQKAFQFKRMRTSKIKQKTYCFPTFDCPIFTPM